MLTDSNLRSKIDALWSKLWSGGLPNPSDVIEQISFLFFLKHLDEQEQDNERAAKRRGQKFESVFPDDKLRWSHWSQLPADQALKQVKEQVFPFIKTLGGKARPFAEYMANAEFKISKAGILIEACRALDDMQLSGQQQDVQGDLFEYILSKLNTAGQNGQFRTPRHIIRMMVQMADPRPQERICDPAAGTCGFLVNAWQHVLESHSDPLDLTYDEEGYPHGLTGGKLDPADWKRFQKQGLTGFDSDSGMVMLRIGCMNLMLHGIEKPNFRCVDTLSKAFQEEKAYDVVLANPPFKGAIDAADVNPTLPVKCKKTEILFLRLLDNGGRAAVIVPDGVLFGSSNAHVEIRKKLIEENRLDGVISMPSGVFRPYAGVSTAILLFTKGGSTERIWFYDMEHDGYSLDDKRQKVAENDIPDLLSCWQHRREAKFTAKRTQRLADLQQQIAPLKQSRLEHQAIIHRLKFEEVIAGSAGVPPAGSGSVPAPRKSGAVPKENATDAARAAREQAETELAELQTRIRPLADEINQLTRQFWVTRNQVQANKYDLSASRYRQLEQDETFYEKPAVTLERLHQLEKAVEGDVKALEKFI